jgi:hypothetical protein
MTANQTSGTIRYTLFAPVETMLSAFEISYLGHIVVVRGIL